MMMLTKVPEMLPAAMFEGGVIVARELPSALFVAPRDNPLELRRALRKAICEAEEFMLQSDRRVETQEPFHHFGDGLYMRECVIPAGVIATGVIHVTTHFCILLKGSVNIIDEFSGAQQLHAPCFFQTTPGTKRVAQALTDATILTVHSTEEKDPEEIMKQITVESFDLIEEMK